MTAGRDDGPRLGVVGAGPNGTYAVERLAAWAAAARLPTGTSVTVFEPDAQDFGCGRVHSAQQPVTSLANRAAGQIALGATTALGEDQPTLPRAHEATFLAWHGRTGDGAPPVPVTASPPRQAIGRALRDAFAAYVDVLRAAGVPVTLVAQPVDDVRPGPDGAWTLVCADGSAHVADEVLFGTGHPTLRLPATGRPTAAGTTRLDVPYPVRAVRDHPAVAPGAVVGLDGLGLTAVDLALTLTEGRGGRFDRDGDGTLAYVPSGREPAALVPFGTTGMPPLTRPVNHKIGRPELTHRAVVLTLDAVDRLRERARRRTGESRLDLDLDVRPLLALEAAVVHYRATLGRPRTRLVEQAATAAAERFLASPDAAAPEHVLAPVRVAASTVGAHEHLTWAGFWDPCVPAGRVDDWHAHCLAFVEDDVRRARSGNVDDPRKAVHDAVWRDLRRELAAVADLDGLDGPSRRLFWSQWMRRYHRHSNGASVEAMEKVVALARAGVLDLGVGPHPVVAVRDDALTVQGPTTGHERRLDVLVHARVHPFHPEHDVSPLYRNLLARGLVRRLGRVDGDLPCDQGLDLDADLHPVGEDGLVRESLTFHGAPAEGARTFRTSLARPGGDGVLEDAAAWVRGVVARTAARYARSTA